MASKSHTSKRMAVAFSSVQETMSRLADEYGIELPPASKFIRDRDFREVLQLEGFALFLSELEWKLTGKTPPPPQEDTVDDKVPTPPEADENDEFPKSDAQLIEGYYKSREAAEVETPSGPKSSGGKRGRKAKDNK